MPEYLITAPDGKQFNVKGDGTREEALERVKARYASEPAPVETPPAKTGVARVDGQIQPRRTLRDVVGEAQQNAPPIPEGVAELDERLAEVSDLQLGESGTDMAKIIPALQLTSDPNEIASIVTKAFPHMTRIDTKYKGEVTPLLYNQKTGQYTFANKPGVTSKDWLRLLSTATAYTNPMMKSSRLAALAMGAGATETGIQGLQAASGGEFNPEDVALSAALAPVAQVGADRVISPLIRRGAQKLSRNVVPNADQVVTAGQRANVPVMTSDVAPPKSSLANLLRQFAERVPVLGTGGRRAAQQTARKDAARATSESIGDFSDSAIVDSLRSRSQQFKRLAGNRLERTRIQFGDEPISIDHTRRAIQQTIDDLSRPGTMPDNQAIAQLRQLDNVLAEGPTSFTNVRQNRTWLRETIDQVDPTGRSQMPSLTKSMMNRLYRSMTRDLDDAVRGRLGAQELTKYKHADAIWANEAERLTKTRLKSILDKGGLVPETAQNMLFSQKPSEVKLLYDGLTNTGRQNARAVILNRVVGKSTNEGGFINPTTLSRQLDMNANAVNTFFKGADKDALQGLQALLSATKRAQESGVITANGARLEALLGISLLGSAAAGNTLAQASVGLGGTVSLGARIYESTPVRNFLIRLSKVKPGSTEERTLFANTAPKVIAFIEALNAHASSSSSSDMSATGTGGP